MPNLARSIAIIAGVASLAAARTQPSPTVLEVVVGNGPHAGTYKMPAAEVTCLHAKKQRVFSAAWKNFDAHDPKAIAEAGIEVSNPDVAGPKFGQVRIAFGDPDKKPTVYSIVHEPITLTIKGKGADIALQGKTPEGVQLRVTAKCGEVMEM